MHQGSAYGGIFHARLTYIREKHGEDGLDDFFQLMRRNGYTGPMNINGYKLADKYPIEYQLILMQTYIERYGDVAFKRMTREVAKRRGIVGFMIRWAGTPEMLFDRAGEYWPNFYDFGTIEGEVLGEGHGVLRGNVESPNMLFCQALSEYFAGILESVRVKGIQVDHTKCVHRGSELCEWELRWKR